MSNTQSVGAICARLAFLVAAGYIATASPLFAQFPYWLNSTSATSFQPILWGAQFDKNAGGTAQTINMNGLTFAALNPFFQPLGTNGRTCATCHQPANAMSISVTTVRQRYIASRGADPLFAPVDGANCPDAVTSSKFYAIDDPNNPRSLLLNRALIRIGLPWPPKGIVPEFYIAAIADPTHCEFSKNYGVKSATPTVSVYRRSLMAGNLKYVTTVGTGSGVVPPGVVLTTDPYTGLPESGNIMFDGREPNLQHQAMDAITGHAQAAKLPKAAIIQQIVDFENNIYTAQVFDSQAGPLTDGTSAGGPATLASGQAGLAADPNTFSLYGNWAKLPAYAPYAAQRASVARGEAIFNGKSFIISNVAGINDLAGVNLLPGACTTCHGNINAGNDVHPLALMDEGTSGPEFGLPAADLPNFQLVCKNGTTTPFNGTVVWTRDPGLALITGKCADIGKIKSSQLRGLAARAPYFHDGSAATLADVVTFYNKRFSIGLTAQEMQDLVNFLRTL